MLTSALNSVPGVAYVAIAFRNEFIFSSVDGSLTLISHHVEVLFPQVIGLVIQYHVSQIFVRLRYDDILFVVALYAQRISVSRIADEMKMMKLCIQTRW
jgi:hypothetical protein